MSRTDKPARLFRKQTVMRRMVYALLPCVAGGVYFFGWRSVVMVAAACLVGVAAEWLFCRRRREPITEAVFVTCIIYALILPPTAPWHVLIIGALFSVAVTKEIFGGFGKNFFNPAMAGRCFVYICFPVAMTARWAPAAQGVWGALGRWTTAPTADAITSATPMALAKLGQWQPDVLQLFLGRVSGTMGVTCVPLILLGGAYLWYTRTANRLLIYPAIITYAVLNELLYRLGVEPVPGALPALFGGGFLFGAFYMITEPVSAPGTREGKILYGILIAVLTLIIRNLSIFNGGLMFALLLGNMFASILDVGVNMYKKRRQPAPVREASG